MKTYFWRGLSTEENFRFRVDWASLIVGGNLPFLVCFTLYLRAISKYKPPVGACIWRGDLTEGFLHYEFRGALYLEGLIFGILRYPFFKKNLIDMF